MNCSIIHLSLWSSFRGQVHREQVLTSLGRLRVYGKPKSSGSEATPVLLSQNPVSLSPPFWQPSPRHGMLSEPNSNQVAQMTPSEWIELVTSVVDSVAWPVCVGILVFLFRSNLRELINLIETVRFRGVELKLRKNVENVAEKANLLRSSCESKSLRPPPEITSLDPGIAVIRAWASVETAIENLTIAYRHELGKSVPRTTRHRIERLLEARIINDQLAGILRDMNGTRNMIAHGEDIPLHYETVRLFEETAAYVESIVEQLEESQPNPG